MTKLGESVVEAVQRKDTARLDQIAQGGITWLDPTLQTTAFLADKNYVRATAADVVAALSGCTLKNSRATEAEEAGQFVAAIGAGSSWSCDRPAGFLPSSYPKRDCYDQDYWLSVKPSPTGDALKLSHGLRWNSGRCGPRLVPPPPSAPPSGWKKERG